MKQVKVLSAHDVDMLNDKISEYLEDGWSVVPESLSVSTSGSSGGAFNETIFAIVIER